MKPVLGYDMDLHLPLELQLMEHCIKIWNFDSFKAGFSFDPGLAVKDSDIWNSSDSSLRGHVSSDQKKLILREHLRESISVQLSTHASSRYQYNERFLCKWKSEWNFAPHCDVANIIESLISLIHIWLVII